ncbi:MAG: hypothetical protein EYC70_05115 [Planctomycetota bacterium]|nr:MAG: hypothetical protein EYC70_05115 [Planctomycetota bacterium]
MNRIATPALFLILSAGLLAAQEPGLADRLASLEHRLEQSREELHVPGLAIAVVKDDQVIFAKGFGLADIEQQRPVTPDTLFAIGSSTKAFTATLVAMLVDEGKLAWDDPVTKVLPEFVLHIRTPEEGAQVTFRDLLSHRTGFARADLLWASGKADAATILATVVKAEPWTGFRTKFQYNNIMYLAAGQASAQVAGTPWPQLLRQRILDPLGMRDTSVSVSAAQEDERLALGYVWDEDRQRFEHQPMRGVDNMAPAGAINSHVLDMAQWLRFQLGRGAIAGKRLVSAAAHGETWTRQIDVEGGIGYGLGWFLRTWNGQPVVEHGGNIDGFGAQVALLPESGVGFVLLTNVTATPLQGTSMEMVWNALLADPAAEAPAASDHSPYLGTYVANFAHFQDAKFTVLEQHGKLAVDVPGQMVFALKEAGADGKWVFELTDAIAVSFERDAQGAVIGMTMFQGGMTFEVPREGYTAPAEIDLEEARRYLGRYHDPDLKEELTVLVRNNRLAVDVPRQMVCELHKPDAEGRRLFRVNAELAVKFEEDAAGTVTGLTFYERGSERNCPRVAGADAPALITLDALHALRRSDARRDALAKLGTFRIRGKLRLLNMGVEGTMTLLGSGSDRSALHIDLEPFATIQAGYDRGTAATSSSLSPYRELAGAYLEEARVEHPAAAIGDWRQFFATIAVLRADQLDGRKVWVVRLSAGEDVVVTAWVDAETGDTLREDSLERVPGVGIQLPETTRYSDFRSVDGLAIPHRIDAEDEATGKSVFLLEQMETRLQLPDDAFRIAKPAGS